MGGNGANQLGVAMAGLMQRFRPLLEERIALLECTATAAAGGTLTAEQLAEGYGAAHKLAGVLGTFGLQEGTVLAREAETICSGKHPPDTAESLRIQAIAAQLRVMLAESN